MKTNKRTNEKIDEEDRKWMNTVYGTRIFWFILNRCIYEYESRQPELRIRIKKETQKFEFLRQSKRKQTKTAQNKAKYENIIQLIILYT